MSEARFRELLKRTRDFLAPGMWDEVEDYSFGPEPVVTANCAACGADICEGHEDDCEWSALLEDIEEAIGNEERCGNCGDGSGWARIALDTGSDWGACSECNVDGQKPKPPLCTRCRETFPFCGCQVRGSA